MNNVTGKGKKRRSLYRGHLPEYRRKSHSRGNAYLYVAVAVAVAVLLGEGLQKRADAREDDGNYDVIFNDDNDNNRERIARPKRVVSARESHVPGGRPAWPAARTHSRVSPVGNDETRVSTAPGFFLSPFSRRPFFSRPAVLQPSRFAPPVCRFVLPAKRLHVSIPRSSASERFVTLPGLPLWPKDPSRGFH